MHGDNVLEQTGRWSSALPIITAPQTVPS